MLVGRSNPTMTLVPTTPDDGTGDAWTVPDLTDWQAVKTGGLCQVCCTGAFSVPTMGSTTSTTVVTTTTSLATTTTTTMP